MTCFLNCFAGLGPVSEGMSLLFRAFQSGSNDGPPDVISAVPSGTAQINVSVGSANFGLANPYQNDPVVNGLTYTPQPAEILVAITVPAIYIIWATDQESVVGSAWREISLTDNAASGSFINQFQVVPGVWSRGGTCLMFPPYSTTVTGQNTLADGDFIQPLVSDFITFGDIGNLTVPTDDDALTIQFTASGGEGAAYQTSLWGFAVPS